MRSFAYMDYEGPSQIPEWQKRLDKLIPRTDELSWLKIVWEPGDFWQPIHRLMLYQMIPKHRLKPDDILLAELEGPNPRKFGHYDFVEQRYIRSDDCPLVSRTQWQLFRETGYVPRPYWVIQGANGGHLLRFSQTDKIVARMKELRTEPPPPGDLPYANYDSRVEDKIVYLDRVRAYRMAIGMSYRDPAKFMRKEQEILSDMQDKLGDWLASQADDTLRQAPHGVLERAAGLDPAPRIFT